MTSALTRTSVTGTDDNTAQGGQLVAVTAEPEVWQQQGSKLQPMGTMRRGNGNVTGGVPFGARPLTAREGKGPDSEMSSGNVVTHALTAEGADASEDGTGRGTPIVPVDLAQVTSGGNWSNPQAGDPAATLAATSRSAVAFAEAPDLTTGDISPSVRTGTGGSATGVATAASVRRLTPVECERLQGFPDEWTAKRVDLTLMGNRWVPSDKGVVEQADAPRYRQLGNSIAVPVFAWVAAGLVLVEEQG